MGVAPGGHSLIAWTGFGLAASVDGAAAATLSNEALGDLAVAITDAGAAVIAYRPSTVSASVDRAAGGAWSAPRAFADAYVPLDGLGEDG